MVTTHLIPLLLTANKSWRGIFLWHFFRSASCIFFPFVNNNLCHVIKKHCWFLDLINWNNHQQHRHNNSLLDCFTACPPSAFSQGRDVYCEQAIPKFHTVMWPPPRHIPSLTLLVQNRGAVHLLQQAYSWSWTQRWGSAACPPAIHAHCSMDVFWGRLVATFTSQLSSIMLPPNLHVNSVSHSPQSEKRGRGGLW